MSHLPPSAPGQEAAFAFLSAPATYTGFDTAHAHENEPVERHDTHGAHVFLHGDVAIKIKRDVAYSYLDFSTLEKRHAALLREFEVNRANAPEIYVEVIPITRAASGELRLGGEGEPVEWALRMRRFPQSALLANHDAASLDVRILKSLADEIFRSHAAARPAAASEGSRPGIVIDQIADALREEATTAAAAQTFRAAASSALSQAAGILDKRARAGLVRRCHGDLHLDNIVVIEGRPRLFDAIEFDEALATVDTLYDLAFTLMDLHARFDRSRAGIVLNRYLWRSRQPLDLEGLSALPLFLAMRAGVRAMVAMQRARLSTGDPHTDATTRARQYLELGLRYLEPIPPLLLAIGGRSGTGKSTLAAHLAPLLGGSVGAVHLRSDLERKALFEVEELTRLPDEAYTPAQSARVYGSMMDQARLVLGAGQSVILDAVFATEIEKHAAESVARQCGVPFIGIWLEAPTGILIDRVSQRVGDASDATAEVVVRQSAHIADKTGWTPLDASLAQSGLADQAAALLRATFPQCCPA